MGSNMQRQAVPLLVGRGPGGGATGMEKGTLPEQFPVWSSRRSVSGHCDFIAIAKRIVIDNSDGIRAAEKKRGF